MPEARLSARDRHIVLPQLPRDRLGEFTTRLARDVSEGRTIDAIVRRRLLDFRAVVFLAVSLTPACGQTVSSSMSDAAPEATEDAKTERPDSHEPVYDASHDSTLRDDAAGTDAGTDVGEANPCTGFASPYGHPCQTTNEVCYAPGAIEAGCTPCVACFSNMCTVCGK